KLTNSAALSQAGAGRDLEKVQAMVEMNKVRQISQQVSAKFGLSAERSLQVAKLSAQWQSLSSDRELTTADVDAFSKKLMGSNMLDIQAAMKESLKGNVSRLAEFVAKAPEVNDPTPEKVAGIVMSMFF